ncbi:MAG TPA: NAD(P)/FAD-dependent oxidoreductase [Burkholderiales bacterium]|nr:NAD(P)/FAD-dependent oxidoreductase [Burkholderiales bacterium]
MSRYDAVIVGAGHNGLTCACYLARGGLKVKVLERRARVGGAAVTEEFHPGFRNSVAAYTVSLLQANVIRELRLAEHGLRIVERPLSNFVPLEQGYLKVGGGLEATQHEFAKFSARDAERLPAYWARLERVADVLRALALETPPNVGGGVRDALAALRTGWRMKALDAVARRDLLGLFTRSAADWLEDWFESDPVKAVFGFDAVVGTYASPSHPGTAYVLLHHCFGEVNGKRGVWGHAIGGMGAISEALAAEARRLGVEIECEAPVAKVQPGAVVLASGEEIAARAVVANVNPKRLFLAMVEASSLERDFRERIERYKCASASFRMNVALSALPKFSCLPEAGPHHASGIIMAPSLDYMDRAYLDARATGMARAPIVEMVIASALDDTLAPKGAHVASLFCQHFAPDADWATRKDEAIGRIFDVVESHAPGFRQSVIAHTALSPADLEAEFGLVGGDIFHGQLSLDQLWLARPVLGYGDYRTPLPGLYLCGSGAHPGGGVTGAPGHNCAREVLRDLK